METEYYKFLRPQEVHRVPPDTEFYGETYRGFLVAKDAAMFLWTIKTKEDGAPPLDLRGSFTNKQLAKDQIDYFFAQEEKNKAKVLS